MAGNLCRCGAYANIVPAVLDAAGVLAEPMRAFGYLRAASSAEAVDAAAADPDAVFLGGGTNLVDLMRLGVRHRPAPWSTSRGSRPTFRRSTTVGCGSVPGSGTATSPLICAFDATSRWCPRHCCPARPASCGTWRPSAGICCSAPDACISRTSASRATSGWPGPAARPRRPAPRPWRAGHQCRVHCHPPVGHGRGTRRPRCGRGGEGPAGDRRLPLDEFYRLPGDDPTRDTTLAHGELITAVELPAARRSAVGVRIARRATGRPSPSPSAPSRRPSRWSTTGSMTSDWRSVPSRPGRGGRASPRTRSAADR